jgi:radical SAM protein with 4Fe4S-binding SPASM domain
MVIYDETLAEVDAFQKEWRGKADFVNFQPKFFSLPRRKQSLCRDLWRILVVLWDGKVVPCCVDFEGDIILGDAEKENLQKIFKGPAMKALRKSHLQKRPPGLCKKCSPYYADYHLPLKALRRQQHFGNGECIDNQEGQKYNHSGTTGIKGWDNDKSGKK